MTLECYNPNESSIDNHIAPSFGAMEIIFCITMYNEEYSALENTLRTLHISLYDYLRRANSEGKFKVCVICDGMENLSSSMKRYLHHQQRVSGGPESNSSDADSQFDSEVYTYRIDPLKSFGYVNTHLNSQSPINETIEIEIIIKKENRGKLHSHWWFFNKQCKVHQSSYCFQIDAGTSLLPATLSEMMNTFQSGADVAAVASNVLIDLPSGAGLLHDFQVANFVSQRMISWPIEQLCGYMSVIPGQCCAMRWSALNNKTADGSSIVDRYLEGKGQNSAFKEVAFLAEDRVLCCELLSHEHADYSLNFAIGSECYTDACDNLTELLKQRRRWINSSFLCRLWSLNNFFRSTYNTRASASQRYRSGLASLSVFWSLGVDYFYPLFALILVSLTLSSANIVTSQTSKITAPFVIIFELISILAWLTPSSIALLGLSNKLSSRVLDKILWACGIVVLLSLIFVAIVVFRDTGDIGVIAAASVPLCLAILNLCGSAMVGRNIVKHSLKTSFKYYLFCFPMQLMLYCYSFFNMADNSWGTKGIAKGGKGETKNQLNRLGLIFVSAWLTANILLFCVIYVNGLELIILKVISYLLLAYFILGFIGVIRLKFKSSKAY